MNFSFLKSAFGPLLAASTEKGLAALLFVESPEAALKDLKKRFPKAELQEKSDKFLEATAAHLSRENSELPNLDLAGTPFQKAVWDQLLKIPCGQTRSYGALAKAIQKPKAVRAVGSAVGDNPVAILVPCHRVLPSTGKLGNYYWGPKIKAQLLKSEGVTRE